MLLRVFVGPTQYCKTRIFRVPFISQISWPWWIRENNGPRIFEYFHMYFNSAQH